MVSLRHFPATPAGAEVDGVEWLQTYSRITISYMFDNDTTQDDVEVKITGFQLEVLVKGEKIKPLCKDLYEIVRPAPQTWWVLQSGENGQPPALMISFTKLKHSAWPELFFSAPMHHLKKGRFAWNQEGAKRAAQEALDIRLNQWETVPGGRPEQDESTWYPPTHSSVFSPISDSYLCSPDDLCIGTSVTQNHAKIVLELHFDSEALAYYESLKPYEDFFGADVTHNSVYVFIRGDDQNPIINASLAGEIFPDGTTWRIGTGNVFRNRQKTLGVAVPTLEITMVKADAHRYEWPKIFESCWQHRLMVKNQGEYEEMVKAAEELEWTDETTDPEHKATLQEKADKLENFVEERFDGIPGATTFRRHGYDINSPDYWMNVYDHVNILVAQQGYASSPNVLDVQDVTA